jgi:hypothetical protein
LQKGLTDLQKAAQQLAEAGPETAQNVSSPPANTTGTQDLSTSLVALDADLKNILSMLPQSGKGSAPAAPAPTALLTPIPAGTTATAKNVAPAAIMPSPPAAQDASQTASQTTTVKPSDTDSKRDLSGTAPSQAIPLSGTIAPQPAASTAATPSFSLNAAVATTASKTDNDADAGDDFLSGGKNSASFTPTPNNAPVTAEAAQTATPYSFANALAATRTINGAATGLPTPVDQVILQMNRNVKNGNDQISLQLHPTDLGKITIKLAIGSDGTVQGNVTADNPQTLALLQKDSRSLERALQDAGLRADSGSLQFNLGGQQGNGNNAGNQANAGTGNGTVSALATASASDVAGANDLGVNAETYYLTPSGVNIQV